MQIVNIASGFTELDKITNGWRNGDLIVIGGRPSMGKTAFGVSLLKNMAITNRIPTAFFYLEGTRIQLTNRLLLSLCLVERKGIEEFSNGDIASLNEEELYRIKDAKKQIEAAPIYLDDTPALSIQELYLKTARMVRDYQIKLIIIDYFQLMSGFGLFSDRSEEVAYMARELKKLAKDLNIPLIVFFQLHHSIKNGDGIDGKRPRLSDLRESDTIEQEADVVCFIHRPEYYGLGADENGNDIHGLAEIIIAKNRNGETGSIRLKFNQVCASFDNFDEV